MTHDALVSCRYLPRCLVAIALAPALAGCPAPRDMGSLADGGSSESSGAMGDSGDGKADQVDDDDLPSDTDGGDEPSVDDAAGEDTGESDTEGDDGPDTSADESSAGAESSGGPPTCSDVGGECAPAFDGAWEGPVALIEWTGHTPPTCAGDFDVTLTTTLRHGLVAPPAVCDCECGSAAGGSCDGELTLTRTGLAGSSCFPLGAVVLDTLEPNSFASLSETGPLGVGYTITDDPSYSGGSCQPLPTSTVTPAYFEHKVALCGASELEGDCASGGHCMPQPEAPAEGQLCIWREGLGFCPDAYPNATLMYDGVVDTRSCSACSCGAPDGACTDGSVVINGTLNGSIPVVLGGAPDGCAVYGSGGNAVSSATWQGTVPTAGVGCDASGGNPLGTAQGVDQVTVCCAD